MSSDSDSDICDFTTDVSKQMSKGLGKFWESYKKTKLASEEPLHISDDNDIDFASQTNPTTTTIKETEAPKPTEQLPVVPVISNVDATNRITNKLNELSQELKTILESKTAKRKRMQAQRRQPVRKKPTLNQLHQVGCLVVSSDDEVVQSDESPTVELNPIITVHVLWRSVDKNMFKIRKYQPLSSIPKYYCEKYSVDPRLLFFTLDDKQVNLDENSFVSLRLDDRKVIEGGILPESFLLEKNEKVNSTSIGALNFKVQYAGKRQNEINVSCDPTDKMDVIFWQVMHHLKSPIECINLYFDGRLLNPNSKIMDLDLEEGDCFDLVLMRK